MHTILLVEVGSTAHGIATGETEDLDLLGVFIEPRHEVFKVGETRPHISQIRRTQPQGVRSGPGDVDDSRYSLRHFLQLAAKGNPTVLIGLMAVDDLVREIDPYGVLLRALVPKLVSQEAGARFQGYHATQTKRFLASLTDRPLGHTPKRPELIERHGFDTKYAAHAVRLALQGIELAQTGRFSVPMHISERELCAGIRRGEMSAEGITKLLDDLGRHLEHAWSDTHLPEHPDREALSEWSAMVHMLAWTDDLQPKEQ